MELYVIEEFIIDDGFYNCDNKLNKVCEQDYYWTNYFLLTKEEVESIKKQLGDKAITVEGDNWGVEIENYNYFIQPANEKLEEYSAECGWNEEFGIWEDYVADRDFYDAMVERANGNYMEELYERAIKKTRILRDFLVTLDELMEEDYEKWKMENDK
jgi:hypothetical protein